MTVWQDFRVDGQRLWSSLMEMARLGATERGGCNRQALTEIDKAGRDLFRRWSEEAGCSVATDPVGNMFARKEGRKSHAAPVLIGSHLDTQPTGGKFDGVYGVLAGLEVLRTLRDRDHITEHPIVVANWTNEEGARFAPAMLGSGVCAGVYTLDYAYSRQDKERVSLREALETTGYLGNHSLQPNTLKAAFELHIEQGPVLESAGRTIGVVTGIQGCSWLDVILRGSPVHAGPTPMETRRDPWRAALPIIRCAYQLCEQNAPWSRCTIGDVEIKPGSRNTVPEILRVSIDLRHPDAQVLENMLTELRRTIEREATASNVDVEVNEVFRMRPTSFDAALIDTIENATQRMQYAYQKIVSGAGHDSLHIATIAPTAMIFVPCAGGISHNEAESATPSDITAGANVLLQATLSVANDIRDSAV